MWVDICRKKEDNSNGEGRGGRNAVVREQQINDQDPVANQQDARDERGLPQE